MISHIQPASLMHDQYLVSGAVAPDAAESNVTSAVLQPVTRVTDRGTRQIKQSLNNSGITPEAATREQITRKYNEGVNTRKLTSRLQTGDTPALDFRSEYLKPTSAGRLSSLGRMVDVVV